MFVQSDLKTIVVQSTCSSNIIAEQKDLLIYENVNESYICQMDKLHFVDCSLFLSEDQSLLILHNRRRKVFNVWFTFGCVAFISSMVFKSMHSEKIAALPLFISTIILMIGVWNLSGTGKIYFEKTEGKLFRFYKHLGYIQKLYTTPLRSIEEVEIISKEKPVLALRIDTNQLIILSSEKGVSFEEIKKIGERISGFLNIQLKVI